jgi:drug/metabolite transporter (DMT)-like permease
MTAPRSRVVTAFAAVYVLWGSTYLFIKFTVQTIPPVGMAGVRFLLAGLLLFAIARLRGAAAPVARHWQSAAIAGVLLMTSNAAVAWSVRRIPSGIASLLVAMTPCWMVLFDWAGHPARRPHVGVGAGLATGLLGIVILVGPGHLSNGTSLDLLGTAAVMGGSVLWAAGSLYARKAPRPESSYVLSGMQMICGGAALSLVAALGGQWDGWSLAQTSLLSRFSFGYLVLFGSIVAYSAYMYLLTVSTPARVSTYAYVNPVVAVFLGWLFAGEGLTPRTMVAAAIIVAGVALIVTFGAGPVAASTPLRPDEVPIATTESA